MGYRAMGFSIPENETEFYRLLDNYGFKYDSSKKKPNGSCQTIQAGTITKIYPSAIVLSGKSINFSGGTYFRLLPRFMINKGFSFYKKNNQPVMLYVHSWEFNKDQPRRNVPFLQQILQSPVTFNTETKLKRLLKEYKFISIKDYLSL